MPSTSCDAIARLGFYYGRGAPPELARHDGAVLQPGHQTAAELQELRRAGVLPLAYLSIGEDPGPHAPWQRPARNPDWGGAHVRLSHRGWADLIAVQARALLDLGFRGLFLDTLDVVETYPEDRSALLEILRRLSVVSGRRRPGAGTVLLANRGFFLLPELARLVDGLVFEAFSCSWLPAGGCAPLSGAELQRNVQLARIAQAAGLTVYALDYADKPLLAAFARHRAELHGLRCVLARERTLTVLDPVPSLAEPAPRAV